MPQTLEQEITTCVRHEKSLPETPKHIRDNLNSAFDLRPYQHEAFGRCLRHVFHCEV